MKQDNAFTGLEAAIVLIAFVVVAAVFSYVVLGAGYSTSQKAQETVYKGVEQSTSNIQLVGSVYGAATDPTVGVDTITLTLGLSPGSQTIDLTKMSFIYTTEGIRIVHPFTNVTQPAGKTTLSQGDQLDINIPLWPPATANQKIGIEIRPSIGSSVMVSRTIPAVIQKMNILY